MKKYKGIFITFEGIDGCGKSTQAMMLFRRLKKLGFATRMVREPGGTILSEKIRRILLDPKSEITPVAELLLYQAARAQLVNDVIRPALQAGEIVVCDRFYDSTTAYQGFGRQLDRNIISRLNRCASYDIAPDLTFIFDVDYATSLARRGRDGKKPDRLEKEKKLFFNRVRRGFRSLKSKRRVILLDGGLSVEKLADVVCEKAETLARKRIKAGV